MLNGLFLILRDAIDEADPLQFKIYQEYFKKATEQITNIKNEIILDIDEPIILDENAKKVERITSVELVQPGRVCLKDLEDYLDDRRINLRIAHTDEQFFELLDSKKSNWNWKSSSNFFQSWAWM